jgi:AcrR family transcriptional regulator
MSKQNPLSETSITRKPVQARGIQTRKKILVAGEKLFIQYGFHDILADDIAREAGVSVGSFYSYFKDKRALFLTILENISNVMMVGINENLSILMSEDSPDLQRLAQKTIETLFDAHQTFYPLFQQAQQMATFDEEINHSLAEGDSASLLVFEKILLHMAHRNDKNLRSVAYVLYHASEGIIHSMIAENLQAPIREEILLQTSRLIANYIQDFLTQV